MDVIKELWHGNIIPQEDSRTNTKEMKELIGYIARHHEELEKDFTDEQKVIFEKFQDCWGEYATLAEEAIFKEERVCQYEYEILLDIKRCQTPWHRKLKIG